MRSSSSADHPVAPIALDQAGATDPPAVGAKAAALARARQAGLPVLPGYALAVGAAREAVRAACRGLDSGGAGAARRAALGVRVPEPLRRALSTVVDRLGGRVIVRSSSPLEADHRWSGAFSSISEVGRDDIATAVRACWASAFAPDPLARAAACGIGADQLGLGVLIQPELTPTAGGLARVVDDGIQVTAVAGHPGPLLAGWVAGETSRVSDDTDVGALARRVAQVLGHDTIEWATAGGTVYLLQSSRAADPPPRQAAPPGHGLRVGGTAAVAGDAVGPLRYVRPHETVPSGAPAILVCERPVPALAPLLFGARGLVSVGGPVDCHLVEVARSLGVPVLVHTPVERLTGPLDQINVDDRVAAIDGERAELVVLNA